MKPRAALLLAAVFLAGTLAPSAGALEVPAIVPVEERAPADAPQASPPPTKRVAPFGVIPEDPNVIPMMGGGGPLPESPYARFLTRAVMTPGLEPHHLAAYAADYFHDLGYNTPGAVAEFEENATLPYSYVLGDVDGDGHDDLALDTYCTDRDACIPTTVLQTANVRGYVANTACAWPHRILAHSGRSGQELWNVSLDTVHPIAAQTGLGQLLGCSLEFVVGSVPNEETGLNDLIIYRWVVLWPLLNAPFRFGLPAANDRIVARIDNYVYAIDAAEGKTKWSLGPFSGHWVEEDARPGPWVFSAHNLFTHPILNVAESQGLRIVPEATAPGLQLQGVGFNMTIAAMPTTVPYQATPYMVVYSYQPNEWAMGVDPANGQKRFWRETFQPNERLGRTPVTPQGQDLPAHAGPRVPHGNRSVWPQAFQNAPFPFTRCAIDATVTPCLPPRQWLVTHWNTGTGPQRAQGYYWGNNPCCFDITGDTIPDLVYTVTEWSSTPVSNYEGPYNVAGRLVAFSGADGSLLYDRYVEPSINLNLRFPPPPTHPASAYRIAVEYLGDANGDGASDYFLHETYSTWDYHHNLTVISGVDGQPLWKMDWPREFVVQPIGDADHDGGADFIFFDYTFDWPAIPATGRGDGYSLSNVTYTPVTLYDGATGERRYQARTFQAPNDLLYMLEQYRINGVPDYDGDQVGDVWLDDPLYLPDLTLIHRFDVISGATNKTLFKIVSAGSFAFPSNIGDVTADGIDDFVLLSGEPIDLWGTTFYGNNGTALWSRRILATRTTSFSQALPSMRTHHIRTADSPTQNYLVNFHFRVSQVTFISAFGGISQYATTRPQVTMFGGGNGTVPWALPSLWDQNLTVMVPGLSPASVQFQDAMKYDAAKDHGVDPDVVTVPTQLAVGVATFGVAFGASFLLTGRRWRF